MTRLVALLAALAVAGCGGSSEPATTQAPAGPTGPIGYPYRYVVETVDCATEQAGRCIDRFVPNSTSERRAVTCQVSNPSVPSPYRSWCFYETDPVACTPSDCREFVSPYTQARGAIVVECATPLPKARQYFD